MISICIPAYKLVSLTHEAVASILRQDADVELVVLDDFYLLESTPENLREIEALREYLHADQRVKCFTNEKLLPIQDNWNKAVSLCTGNYVKLLGADDRMLAGSVQKMYQMIAEQPEIDFHGHLANVIDAEGSLVRQQRPYGVTFVNRSLTGVEALKGKLRQQVRFKEPACNFYKKQAWEKVGGYEDKYRFAFDVHFNVKMMSACTSMLWNEYLVELRRHQSSDGAQLPATLALADLQGVIEQILRALGSECSTADRAAASGLLQYRVIELAAQRARGQPKDIARLVASNLSLFVGHPAAYYWMARLLYSRIVFGDVQQH